MTQEYYTLVTDIGIAKFTNAQITQTAVNLTQIAVGDGDGSIYNPTQAQTALKNERWRGQVATVAVDAENENYINIETTIPGTVGGWMIREAGVFDDEGDLILISKQPETFKPTFGQGSVKDMIIKLVMELSNTDVAAIKIDPTIITASQKYVDNKILELDEMVSENLKDVKSSLNGAMIYPLHTETFEGSHEAYHPDRLYFPNGKFGYKHWLVHTPLPYERAPYVDRWECPSILVSNDGDNYMPHPTLPNPLVDLTDEQIAKRDYFSDPSFTVNANGHIEIWYRHTNGDNTSNTNMYRMIYDGTTLSEPQMVQDSQNTSVVVSPVTNSNFMRSQSVLLKDDKYIAYYGTSAGMYKSESVDPSTKVWTNLTRVILNGQKAHPWHVSIKEIDGIYYAIAYFNTGGPERVEVYKSTDGVNFKFVRELISVGEKYSNLRGLYQSTIIKVGDIFEVVLSVDLDSQPYLERRGLAIMRGQTIDELTLINVNSTQKQRQTFLSGIHLPWDDKPNANSNIIVFKRDPNTGGTKQGFGVRKQLGEIVPTYWSEKGVQNLVSAYIASGKPSAYPYSHIGAIHIEQMDDDVFYISTAKDKWVQVGNKSHIKKGIKKVELAETLSIDDKVYRLVIELASNGIFDITTITGAVDGQEIILVNVLSTTPITLKQNASLTDGFRLRGAQDKILQVGDTIKLHYITNKWYEV